MQILAKGNGVDLGDLHWLGVVDCGASRGGQSGTAESGQRANAGVPYERSSAQLHPCSCTDDAQTADPNISPPGISFRSGGVDLPLQDTKSWAYQKKNLTASCTMRRPCLSVTVPKFGVFNSPV